MSVKCPYCNKEVEIDHEDGYGYQEDMIYNQECTNCENTFAYYTYIHFTYDVWKADCLNEGECKWHPTNTYPKFATQMVCPTCGATRMPTDEERKQYDIPTYADFRKEMNSEKNEI